MEIDVESCRDLWWAVINRAIRDAHMEWKSRKDGLSEKTTNHRIMSDNAKAAAIRWFTEAGDDFRHVCSLAGADPDFISEAFKSGEFNFEEYRRDVSR